MDHSFPLKTYHSEVPFVFHDKYALLGKGEPELADQVVAYWTNFAATGDPNICA